MKTMLSIGLKVDQGLNVVEFVRDQKIVFYRRETPLPGKVPDEGN